MNIGLDEYMDVVNQIEEITDKVNTEHRKITDKEAKKELSKEKNIFTGKCQVPRSQETESNNYFLMEDRVLCMLQKMLKVKVELEEFSA